MLLRRLFALIAVSVCFHVGGAVSAGTGVRVPGMPSFGISRGTGGAYVVTLVTGESAVIAPGSAVELYLRSSDMLEAGETTKAIETLEQAQKQHLDLSAIKPKPGSDCASVVWDSASMTVLHSINDTVLRACNTLSSAPALPDGEANKIIVTCLRAPIHIADARPYSLSAIIEAESLLGGVTTAAERWLKSHNRSRDAEGVRAMRQSVSEHYAKHTAPLMSKYLSASAQIADVTAKLAVAPKDSCQIVTDLQNTAQILSERLASGWLRVATKRMPATVLRAFRPDRSE